MFEFVNGVDLMASIGLIVVLGFFYGHGLRWISHPRISEYALGAVFGAAAIFQMHQPFEPMNGLIIDLRNIPAALAGAFLGWRGIFMCVVMAVGMRIGISGASMFAGVLGILTAASMGALWAEWTKSHQKRGLKLHLVLAVMISAHLTSALILPAGLRNWFWSEAALPILLINILVVPIVAAILELERRKVSEEMRLRNSVVFDPELSLIHI